MAKGKAEAGSFAANLQLVAGLDRQSMAKARAALTALSVSTKDAAYKGVSEQLFEDAQKFSTLVRDTSMKAAGKLSAEALGGYDAHMADLMQQYQAQLKLYGDSIAVETAASAEIAEQAVREMGEIEAAMKRASQELEHSVDRIEKSQSKLAFNKTALDGLGENTIGALVESLNNMKSGDLEGLTKTLAKVMSGAVATGATGAEAAGAGKLAASLSVLAWGVGALAGAFTIFLGLIMAADEHQKDLNRSLLEGVGLADLTEGAVKNLPQFLEESAQAAETLANEFRVAPKEMSTFLNQLDQAGATFKEITKGATSAGERIQMMEDFARRVAVMGSAMGLSLSEAAEAAGSLQDDLGLTGSQIAESFAQVAESANASSMGTKRFFTSVSQATSGVALYNNRMGETAAILAKTSKILGGTSATEFLQTLTKGYTDESYQDRMKRILIAGQEDTRKILKADAKFAAGALREQLSPVASEIMSQQFNLDVTTSPNLLRDLGAMSDKQTRALLTELRFRGEDQTAMRLEELIDLNKGARGDLDAQAKALDNMSLGAKLNMQMQALGNKRISEMSAVELAAFENYAGISGEQLEQLMRVERALYGEWETLSRYTQAAQRGDEDAIAWLEDNSQRLKDQYGVAIENGKIIHEGSQSQISSYEEYMIAQGKRLDASKEIQSKMEYFSEQTTKNTASLLTVIQNQALGWLRSISGTLEQMLSFMMGGDTAAARTTALDQTQATQQTLAQRLEALSDQMRQMKLDRSQRPGEDPALEARIAAKQKELDQAALAHQAAQQIKDAVGDLSITKEYGDPEALVAAAMKQVFSSDTKYNTLLEGLGASSISDLAYRRGPEGRYDPESGITTPGAIIPAGLAALDKLEAIGSSMAYMSAMEAPLRSLLVDRPLAPSPATYANSSAPNSSNASTPAAGGPVQVNIYGGDQTKVYETVKQAVKAARK